MRGQVARSVWWVVLWMVSCPPILLYAQQSSPEDRTIDVIRGRSDIGPSDQRRIADWVTAKIGKYTDFSSFRKLFRDQFRHTGNSSQFVEQLAAQTAQVAAGQLSDRKLSPDVAVALTQVLLDMNRVETFPAMVSGLEFPDVRVRYLSAVGLVRQRSSIESDDARRGQAIGALRRHGLQETSDVVMSRIYDALAYAGHVGDVFDSYMALFDKRLADRKAQPINRCDGAEISAYEFFRRPAVLNALDANQKAQLVSRLAVFLRLDAERYHADPLTFDEMDKLERQLYGAESMLIRLTGGSGGKISDALAKGGHRNREAVLQQAHRWIGNAKDKKPGVLNKAPWSVPLGAP